MRKYCMRCMLPIEKGDICPRCGEIEPQRKLPHLLLPGTILKERYLIGNALGQGGFGITYIGCDLLLNMRVAIKEYFPNGYANRNVFSSAEVTVSNQQQAEFLESGKDKFLREARVLAEFHDEEGIVDVRDYFKENNTAYIVMEYLDGITLLECLKAKCISPALMIEMITPVMNSLEKIHAKQVIHRDISPDNIMMMRSGKLKLMDFGAARQVDFSDQKSMSVVLKTGFAPVEQYRPRGELGPWTDIYALCATIYMCITGQKPDNALERVFGDSVKWPTELGAPITPAMEAVLKKGMAISWKERYQSIAELRAAFAEAQRESADSDTVYSPISYETNYSGLSEHVSDILKKNEVRESSFQQITGGSPELAATVAVIDDDIAKSPDPQPPNRKPEEKQPKPQASVSRQKPQSAKGTTSFAGQIPKKLKIGVIAAVLVIIIGIIIGISAGRHSDTASNTVAAPTQIVMMKDAKGILDNAGISGIISALSVTSDSYNEKFGAYRADCEISISGQTETYHVVLIYDLNGEDWALDTQSKLIQ